MSVLLGITPWPVVSALILFVCLVVALYLVRHTAHATIEAAATALYKTFRLASKAVARSERKLEARNRDVLLAAGREAKERMIEREFDRINDSVRKDLANFSSLHRSLSESIDRIEKDHQDAVDVPPDPPGWVPAVEAIAELEARDGRVKVGNILSDIHKSLVKAHKEAVRAYHQASATRHRLLRRMRPDWRNIQKTLNHVSKNVDSLLNRSVTIDRLMEEYEDIVRDQDRALSVLSSSSLVNFFVSAFVMLIAIGGATINFSLIARPMAEMVGGTNLIGGFRTADIAAIGALPDKTRVRMIWITFTILFLLASVEAGLAYMREVLLHDELATAAILRGEAGSAVTAASEYMWITTVAQMGMGFILPFALTFVAIPLETFVHSLRTVVGLLGQSFLRALSLLLRMLGNLFLYMGVLFRQIYDLPLFVPLWLFESKAQREAAARGGLGRAST